MFDRASKKLGLEQAVLGTFNNENDEDKPTSKEMEQLLKKGAYALLDDEDEETNQFCADDIDSILAKRTRTRVVEGTKTASWLNKSGMVVSKSKFASEGGGLAGVDVDDPNFWQKVMPDFVTPHLMLEKLNELSDLIDGGTSSKAKKGKGRGRGRWKKKDEEDKKEEESKDATNPVDTEEKPAGNEETEKDAKDGDNDEKKDDAAVEDGGDVEKDKDDENEEKGDAPDEDGDEKNEDEANDEDEEDNEEKEEKLAVLSRTNQRKVAKYMADLKSMMDGILEEAEDDSLQSSDKQACQKLLLTISIKERLFNEEQRHLARSLLKRLEGDRRRRCRTSTDGPTSRLSNPRGNPDTPEKEYGIPDDLLILSKQQRRKRRKDAGVKRRGKNDGDDDEVDEDGYLRHSDDEGDWSDVGDDMYGGAGNTKKRASISIKEARRRRGWAHDDDAATAAGRPWPAFPRHLVNDVLGALLAEVMEYDTTTSGGMFSEPVPRDQYPEYYEQIKKPMDYGSMKEKLDRAEYRSAQAMQKDFILVMQNCVKFNASNSDVVREARQQALMRPTALRNAAKKLNLFLAEDGSVLEIIDDEKDKKKETNPDGTPKKRKRRKKGEEPEEESDKKPIKRRRTKKKLEEEPVEKDDDDTVSDADAEEVPITTLKKPRIKISLNGDDKRTPTKGGKKKKMPDIEEEDEGAEADTEKTPGPKKRRGAKKKPEGDASEGPKKKRKRVEKKNENGGDGDAEAEPPTEDPVDADGDSNADGVEPEADESLSLYLNAQYWKNEREQLEESFEAANELFTKHGPWTLPEEVGEDRFTDVANAVLAKMTKHDHYSVFAEAVTSEEAPDYYEIVQNPMDFSKMGEKIESGAYGSGSKAAAVLYEDFKLVFNNCHLYNDEEGEVLEEATRVFSLLPETYAIACRSTLGKRKNIKDRLSKG
jgi:hypothetical protein